MSPLPGCHYRFFTHRVALALIFAVLASVDLHANTLLYWNGSSPTGPATGTWSMNTNNLTWSKNNDEHNASDTSPQAYVAGTSDPIPVFANGNATDGLPGPYTVTVDNSFGQVYITDMHCDVGPLTLTGGMIGWFGNTYQGPGYNLISALSTNVFTINCALSNFWNSGDGTAFHKYKTGTLILGAANTWSNEAVMIEGGTLMLSVDQSLPIGSGLILGNGDGRSSDGFVNTPPTFNTGGHNHALGTLTLTGPNNTIARTIDFNNGGILSLSSTLSFSNSSSIAWVTSNNASNSASPGSISLMVTNYALGKTKLRFGTDHTGLTATQLGQIQFQNYANLPGVIDNNGYVTPALPVMQPVVVTGTTVQITWSTVPNVIYQLQFRNTISSSWQSLGDYSGNGSSVTAIDTLNPVSRYYRVEVVP